MKFLLTRPFACFDLETTGVDVESDRIVSAAFALIEPTAPKWGVTVSTWLADPGVDIPEGASAVHGITTAHAREHGRPLVDVCGELASKLQECVGFHFPIVTMNGCYDLTLLDRNMRRGGLPSIEDALMWDELMVIDVLVLDKHLDPYRKGTRKLSDPAGGLCEWYGVRIDGAHDAAFDALAAARVAYKLALMSTWSKERLVSHYGSPALSSRYGDRHNPVEIADRFVALSALTPGQVHAAQISWRADQQASFAEHLHKKWRRGDPPIDEPHPAWPMIPYTSTTRGATANV